MKTKINVGCTESIFISIFKVPEVREMGQWLRGTALEEDPVLFQATTFGLSQSQAFVTPVPGDPKPMASIGSQLRIPTQKYTFT